MQGGGLPPSGLGGTPGVTYTQAELALGEPIVRLDVDEVSAGLAGLRLSDIAGRLRAGMDGVGEAGAASSSDPVMGTQHMLPRRSSAFVPSTVA